MAGAERVGARETFERVKSGNALLVCAYEDEEKFKALHLEGAISLEVFKSRLGSIPKAQEIIFYCA
jgi:hypothetical protein